MALIQTTRQEQRGKYILDIHRVPTEDNAELAVGRIRKVSAGGLFRPVILLHGTYSRRNFWLSSKGAGMGAWLAEAGFDVWIPELRGHGLSPKGKNYSQICAEDHIRYDVPAIDRFVRQQTRYPVLWVGHSFGGLFVLASLSAGWLGQAGICGVVTFGSQISKGDRYLKIPPVAWGLSFFLKWLGYLPAPKLGLGPEIEPAGVIRETIGWKKLAGKWRNAAGLSYWDGLARIDVPVLSLAAAADKNDPPEGCRQLHERLGSEEKAFVLLGEQTGFSKNYDHIGMVISPSAQQEIWPCVTLWLENRSM
ncbi:MAG: alpha/beta fold hydrolase [Thermodesulfobacteriota bacterium]